MILADTLGKNRLYLLSHMNEPVDIADVHIYKRIIEKRSQHIPYQYLFNTAYFLDYSLYVDENVLIPRPETEELVQYAKASIASIGENRSEYSIVDIGAGSGCISVALADAFHDMQVIAVEKEHGAAEVARRNISAYKLDNVTVVEKDIADIEFRDIFSTPLCVVSNPPYVLTGELNSLSEEVRHEPLTALDGGPLGIDCYRTILERLSRYDRTCIIFFEIGYNICEAVRELMCQFGVRDIGVICDVHSIQRIVKGELQR